MKLHEKKKMTTRSKKRLGRGYGSGKGGHTVGRGQKGQKSRYSIPTWFTGTSWVWFKRLPFLRGKSRFKSLSQETVIITLSDLEKFKSGSTINRESLVKAGLITKDMSASNNIKVLSSGNLTKKIKLALPASKSVISKVESLGGEYIGEAA